MRVVWLWLLCSTAALTIAGVLFVKLVVVRESPRRGLFLSFARATGT
jgi:hypothetical protein